MNEKYYPLKVLNEDIEIMVKGDSFLEAKSRFERCLQRLVDPKETQPVSVHVHSKQN